MYAPAPAGPRPPAPDGPCWRSIGRAHGVLALILLLASCAGRTGPRRPGPVPRDPAPTQVVAPPDGTLLGALDVDVRRHWGALDSATRARFDETRWETARTTLPGRAQLLTYASGGQRVGALLVRPERVVGRRIPVVVVNRDGVGDEGLDVDALLVELEAWTNEGYVALASAYQGSRLSRGRDAPGRVDDVLALLALVERLAYADHERVYLLGRGGGALRTLAALESGARVRAAALVATDLPVDPAAPASVPVLLVHGARDGRCPLAAARALRTRLAADGVEVELQVEDEGDADLHEEEQRVHDAAARWFVRHGGRSLLN